MGPRRDLRRLQQSGLRRVAKLRELAADANAASSQADREIRLAWTLIEMHNLWHGFCRSLFLSSALRAWDGTGKRVAIAAAPAPKSVEQAVGLAIQRVNPSRYGNGTRTRWTWFDEPKWQEPATLLNCLRAVGADNISVVTRGLTLPTRTLTDLPTFRNFYAHRNRSTASKVGAILPIYGFPRGTEISTALLSPAISGITPRPQILLFDLIDDLASAVTLAV
jgi:hypothetical protein